MSVRTGECAGRLLLSASCLVCDRWMGVGGPGVMCAFAIYTGGSSNSSLLDEKRKRLC